jgi:chemotaxis protein CheD
MIVKRNRKLGQYMLILYAGEYFVSTQDIILSTVLGSCVAVCVYDSVLGVGGMNHFMLPENVQLDENSRIYTRDTKYGIHAMDMVINDALKKGAKRENLRAKIFGGASSGGNPYGARVGENNVKFAEKYLFLEGIPLVSRDTEGKEARKLFFYPQTGKVFLKRIHKPEYFEEVERMDREAMGAKMKTLEKKPDFIDFSDF